MNCCTDIQNSRKSRRTYRRRWTSPSAPNRIVVTPGQLLDADPSPWLSCFLVAGLFFIYPAIAATDPGLPAEKGAMLVERADNHPPIEQELARAESSLAIEYKQGRVSVVAEAIPLAQVLREVAQRAGIEILGSEKLQESISVSFSSLSIREALQKLLVSVNHLVIEDKPPQGGTKPMRVLIVGRRSEASLQSAQPEAIRNEEELSEVVNPEKAQKEYEKRLKAVEASAQAGDEQALRQALLDSEPLVQARALELLAAHDREKIAAHLIDLTKTSQPQTRIQALHLLSESELADEETIVSSLGDALVATDENVKAYAIEALAKRDGPEAMTYLQQAFRDPDPKIRRMVVENAAPQDAQGVLLQEARWDPDETVRSFASFWLEQLGSEDAQGASSNMD